MILAVEVMDLLDALVTTIAGPVIRPELGGSLQPDPVARRGVHPVHGDRPAHRRPARRHLRPAADVPDRRGRLHRSPRWLCGLAQCPGVLIGARAVQGLFGAVMLPQGLGMIKQMFTPAEQAKAFGAFGPVMGLGAVGGPILAGWLVDADYFGTGWRMIFFINLPLGIFAVLGAVKFLPEFRSERRPRLDLAGVLLAAVGAFLLLFPLVQGRELDWPVWVFVMLAPGVVVFGLFGVYESRRERRGPRPAGHPEPVPQARVHRRPARSAWSSSRALIGTGLIFTLYLQVGLGYSPLKAGLTTLPQALGTVAGFVAAGAGLSEKLGRKLLLIGTAIMALGTVGVAVTVQLAGADITPCQLIPALVPLGAGMGLAMAPFFNIVLAGVDDEETGSASGRAHLGAAARRRVRHRGARHDLLRTAARRGGRPRRRAAPELRTGPDRGGRAGRRATGGRVAACGHCLQDRMAEKDPAVQPASCRAQPERTAAPEVGRYAQQRCTPASGTRRSAPWWWRWRCWCSRSGWRSCCPATPGRTATATDGRAGSRGPLTAAAGRRRRTSDRAISAAATTPGRQCTASTRPGTRRVVRVEPGRPGRPSRARLGGSGHSSSAADARGRTFSDTSRHPARPLARTGLPGRARLDGLLGRALPGGQTVGRPAARQASKPPARSVARSRPRSCSAAAARLLV